jgi:small GTP-binding protein
MADRPLPRVIFIGDASVGKTSIIIRVTTGAFDASPAPTIGAGVRPVTVKLGNKSCSFHLWDTAGQEIYRSIVPLYFKQAVAAVLVFSLNDSASFTNLPEWVGMLREHAPTAVPIIVVGNKTDLEPHSVDTRTAKKWTDSSGYPLFLTSAVSGEGIQQLFECIAEQYVLRVTSSDVVIASHGKHDGEGCC